MAKNSSITTILKCCDDDVECRNDPCLVHVYEINPTQSSLIRSTRLELDRSLGSGGVPSRQEVAEQMETSQEAVSLGRFGEAFSTSNYAVVNHHSEEVFPVFLALPDESLPLLLAAGPDIPVQDVVKMARRSKRGSPPPDLPGCLLREGQTLTSGALSDHDVQPLSLLQLVRVEEKTVNFIYYQRPDVRRKLFPKVPNLATVGEIRAFLETEVMSCNREVDLTKYNLFLSAGERLFSEDDFQPHIDIIDSMGNWKSRRVDNKYFTLHIFPRDTPKLLVNLTYRRGCDRELRERRAVVIVATDSSIQALRDNVARLVSLKPGHAIRLCDKNGRALRMSAQESVASLPNLDNHSCSLYAELESATMVYVEVHYLPSGSRTSVEENFYSWDTVADLGKSVAAKLAVDPDLLFFKYDGQKMDRDEFLGDKVLKDKSKIHCTFLQRGAVVSVISGANFWRRLLVWDATTTTVEDLERWLKHSTGDNSAVSLVLNGHPLDSALPLAEVGLAKRSKLMVLRSQPVNAVQQVSFPFRRVFEVEDSCLHTERFAYFPNKNSTPFYAPPTIRLGDLQMDQTSCPSQSSSCSDPVEGICILDSRTPEIRPPGGAQKESSNPPGEAPSMATAEAEAMSNTGTEQEVTGDNEREAASPQEVPNPLQIKGVLKESEENPSTAVCEGVEGTAGAAESVGSSSTNETAEEFSSTYGVDIRQKHLTAPSVNAGQLVCNRGRRTGDGTTTLEDFCKTTNPQESQWLDRNRAYCPCRSLTGHLTSEARGPPSFPIPEVGSDNLFCEEFQGDGSNHEDNSFDQADGQSSETKPNDSKSPFLARERGRFPEDVQKGTARSEASCVPNSTSLPHTMPSSLSEMHGGIQVPTNAARTQWEIPSPGDGDHIQVVDSTSEEAVSMSPPADKGPRAYQFHCSRKQDIWISSQGPMGSGTFQSSTHFPEAPLSLRGLANEPPLQQGVASTLFNQGAVDRSHIPDQILKTVALELGKDWSKLCVDLEVKSQDIEAIMGRFPQDVFNQAFGGLKHWRRAKGRQATVEVLKSCLVKNELTSIAEMI